MVIPESDSQTPTAASNDLFNTSAYKANDRPGHLLVANRTIVKKHSAISSSKRLSQKSAKRPTEVKGCYWLHKSVLNNSDSIKPVVVRTARLSFSDSSSLKDFTYFQFTAFRVKCWSFTFLAFI